MVSVQIPDVYPGVINEACSGTTLDHSDNEPAPRKLPDNVNNNCSF